MCGRLSIVDEPCTQELLERFGVYLNVKPFLPLLNVGPSDSIPIIFERFGHYKIKLAIWSLLLEATSDGIKPKAGLSTFNAKAERLDKSSLWRKHYPISRCIIPATGFYEFKRIQDQHYPYYIKPVNGAIAFAGLFLKGYFHRHTIYSCTLITTDHHPKFAHIHDNTLPVMLQAKNFDSWLDSSCRNTEKYQPLFEAKLHTNFRAAPVSQLANKSQNKTEECITPIGESEFIPADFL